MVEVMDRAQAQRHTVSTLMTTQVLGGIGLSAGATVGSLLAEKISGRTDLAGLGGTFQTLGAALLALPLAAIAHRAGRRPSLTIAYAAAVAGALLVVAASAASSFALFLLGSVLLGSATAANSAARYAAADLALPEHRGRDLSLVVWVTTAGSVLGPNLVGPAEPIARTLGLDVLVGPFVISTVVLLVAASLMWVRLRPDPLLLSRTLSGEPPALAKGSLSRGLAAICAHPLALAGVTTMALGHVVMVSIMVMTPLHMVHGHASLSVVGFVISGHIVGMFAFAPVMGIAVDRFGARAVALVGGLILLLSTLRAGVAEAGFSMGLAIALFLLGLGWSATFVSGSTMLVGAVSVRERAGAQGVGDLVMGLSAAGGGAAAGVVVQHFGYGWLAHGALLGAVAVLGVSVLAAGHRQANHARGRRRS
ncbi:MAG: MFS transporter [Tetrasphaera sp.]